MASIPSSAEQETYFRLVDVDDVERFAPGSLMESDRRFTLLQLRDQGVCVYNRCHLNMHIMKSTLSPEILQ